MSRIDLVALAQQRVRDVVKAGDVVIDATLGNGHDALFLAQLVGATGHLYGFDIQPAALAATQQRLAQHQLLARATLIEAGHETMAQAIPQDQHGQIKAVMFNLGYLPGNDHTVRTRTATTLQALESARTLLAHDGLIIIVAYTGHTHGREETEAVKAWARSLEGQDYAVEITIPPSRHGNAPELVVVRRVGQQMTEVHGQCSCGAIGYSFSANSLMAYQCHCSICRKATGSAFSTTLMAPESGFTWLRGETLISSYAKDNGYKVNFCSRCGSPVPNKFRDFPLLSVPVGSIDGEPPIKVVAQLYLGSRAHWDTDTFQGHSFNEMPSLDEMFELLHVDGKIA